MPSFVTGGNGFVGRFFVEWLLGLCPQEQIYCLVRNLDASQWMAAYPNITRIEGNLLSPDTYRDVVGGVDYVYHLAAKLGLRNGQEFYEQNAVATERLVQSIQSSKNLRRLVFISSIAAVDRDASRPAIGPLTSSSQPFPGSDYGKSKLLAEEAIQNSGLPFTILRPAYIYGGRTRKGSSVDTFLQDILRRKSYTTIPFPGRVSAIDVRDLAETIWRAGQSPDTLNQTYFASDPAPLSVSDIILRASTAFNIPLEIRNAGQRTMQRLQTYCYAKASNPVIARILFEDAFYCDSQPLWHDLSWQPAISQKKGVMDALSAYCRMEGIKEGIRGQ